MDTSNSAVKHLFNFTVRKLDDSEDERVKKNCERLLNETIALLKPILKYVATVEVTLPGRDARRTKLAIVCDEPEAALFIDLDGNFIVSWKRSSVNEKDKKECIQFTNRAVDSYHHYVMGYWSWIDFIFSDVLYGLQKALQIAVKKQKERLAKNQARLSRLNAAIEALTK